MVWLEMSSKHTKKNQKYFVHLMRSILKSDSQHYSTPNQAKINVVIKMED